VKAAKFVVVRI